MREGGKIRKTERKEGKRNRTRYRACAVLMDDRWSATAAGDVAAVAAKCVNKQL